MDWLGLHREAQQQHPAPADYAPPPDGDGEYDLRGNVGADRDVVEFAEQVAGDGELDDRCARILAAFGPRWWPE